MGWLKNSRAYFHNELYPGLSELPEAVRTQLSFETGRTLGVFPTRYWVVIVGMMLISCALLFGIDQYLRPGSTHENVLNTLSLIWSVFTIAMIIYFIRRANLLWLHNELNRIGVRHPRCLICGYDLRGTPKESTSCPECGATVAVVTSSTPDGSVTEGLATPPAEPGAEGGGR